MPVLAAWIWAALAPLIPYLVGRILIALGLSTVAYAGIDLMVTAAEAKVIDYLRGTGADMYAMLSYLGVVASIKMHGATMLGIVGTKVAVKSIKAVAK